MSTPATTTDGTLLPQEPNFLAVATAAIERGFAVTPVEPKEKRGVFWGQYKYPAKNLSEVLQFSKDYPDHNVGIVSRRGVGNLTFLDIDADGVVERIETETGHPLPATYTVQSRPKSAPFKKHFYFLQTKYSFNAFGRGKSKEINVKDLSIEGKQPTLFDLKGIGGGGLVVAAGSIRDSGEIYADNGDVPIVPLPDWLVDWILRERDTYRSEAAKLREKAKAAMATAVQAKQKGTSTRVPRDLARTAIQSRVGTFASLGVRRKTIERLVKEQIEDFIEGGKDLAIEYKDFIHKEAHHPEIKIGKLSTKFLPRKTRTPTASGSLTIGKVLRRHDVMDQAIQTLPDTIRTSLVRARLSETFKKHGLTLDRTKATDRAVTRALRRAGFKVTGNGGNERIWSRQ